MDVPDINPTTNFSFISSKSAIILTDPASADDVP
jgi:hypothetical protein